MFLKEEIHTKAWGEERWIVNDSYCGKILVLKRGFRCSLHFHKKKDEVFYIISGSVLMEINGEKQILNPGDSVRVFQLDKHRFSGIEDSKIFECSTTHSDDDSYRIEPSGVIPCALIQ
jgi:mannose-6-phosphate isomerase-like protein (cupin superfamily)